MDVGPGHNEPPLEDRLFTDPQITPAAVLEAVASHLRREREKSISDLADRAKALAANRKRLPEKLDEAGALAALSLLSALDLHGERVAEEREAVVSAAKAVTDELVALCKPLDAGLAPLEKDLRPLLEVYVLEKLDAHNAERTDGESPMTSFTLRGPSGAKATVTDGWENAIVDPAAVPRDLCVPDQKLVDSAVAERKTVPGVERRRKPALRISK